MEHCAQFIGVRLTRQGFSIEWLIRDVNSPIWEHPWELTWFPAKSKNNLAIWFSKKLHACHCRTSMKNNVIPWKIHRFLFYKLPYIIIFTMFFTFIWFIFIAYSVSGYHKTFLTFSNIYKCSMKVIIVQLCGQPPLRPIWQLIRVAKVVHLKAIEQPRRTFFVSCFPPRQRQQQQRQHLQVQTNTEEQARTHPYHNRRRHHGIPRRRRQHDVPREQWQHCHTFRAMRRSKEQRSTGGGQWGAGGRMGNGLGLNE